MIIYTVSEHQLLWVVIYFVYVCVNFPKFIHHVMFRKPVPVVRCQCCATLLVAVVVAARVLKQLTVSDRQLILLKLCMSVCARVCLVMEVKVNLIRCDIRE